MFQPVSRVSYLRCAEDKQVLVCVCDTAQSLESLSPTWKDRAVALFHFTEVSDVLRDVLANPQIRAVVLIGDSSSFKEQWAKPIEGLPEEHVSVVRQFVDLYDGDCGIYGPLPPFWPKRLVYELPKEDVASRNNSPR